MVLIRASEIDEQAHTLQPHTTAVKAQLDDVVAGHDDEGGVIHFPDNESWELRIGLDSQSAIRALS